MQITKTTFTVSKIYNNKFIFCALCSEALQLWNKKPGDKNNCQRRLSTRKSCAKSTYISLFLFILATKPHTRARWRNFLSLGAHFFHNWIKPAKDNNFFISASRRLMRRPECSLLHNAEKYTRRCVCMEKNPHEIYLWNIALKFRPVLWGDLWARKAVRSAAGGVRERVGQKGRNIYVRRPALSTGGNALPMIYLTITHRKLTFQFAATCAVALFHYLAVSTSDGPMILVSHFYLMISSTWNCKNLFF